MSPRPDFQPLVLPTGRPSKSIQYQRYRSQELIFRDDVCSDDDLIEILRGQVSRAKSGEPAAVAFVAAYRLGRPPKLEEGQQPTFQAEGDINIALLTEDQLRALASLGDIQVVTTADDPEKAIDAGYLVLPGPTASG